jgi:hypothetical protein
VERPKRDTFIALDVSGRPVVNQNIPKDVFFPGFVGSNGLTPWHWFGYENAQLELIVQLRGLLELWLAVIV